jgi:hypothetical protein
MASITADDLVLEAAGGREIPVRDLLAVLLGLIEQDPEARAYLVEMLGAVAPPGEAGPAGVAWLPDLAVNREHCIEIVRWFAWPADKGPPPTGVLSEDGIINAELQTQRNIEQLVAAVVAMVIREYGGDVDEARRWLERNPDVIAEAIMGRGAQTP